MKEPKKIFIFYSEETTPAVGKVIEALDKERMAIMKGLCLFPTSFLEYFYQIGMTTKETYKSGSYYRVTKESPPNTKIKAPDSLKHRFFIDDIPYGMIPMESLDKILKSQNSLPVYHASVPSKSKVLINRIGHVSFAI